MAVFSFIGFSGTFPKVNPRALPQGSGVTAQNLRTDTAALQPIYDAGAVVQASATAGPAVTKGLFKFSDTRYIESPYDTKYTWFSMGGDTHERLIYSSSSHEARVTTPTLVGASTGDVASYRKLGVPAPTGAATASITGSADNTSDTPETRYYTCTYVNEWGAEGPPGPPSAQVEFRYGQTVTLTSIPNATDIGTGYQITHVRIYRVNTASSGVAEYQYVGQTALTALPRTDVVTISDTTPYRLIETSGVHGLSLGAEVDIRAMGPQATAVPKITISGISSGANALFTTSTVHGFTTGDYIRVSGVHSMPSVNNIAGEVIVVDTTTFYIRTGVTYTLDTSTSYYIEGGGSSSPQLFWTDSPFSMGQMLYAESFVGNSQNWGTPALATLAAGVVVGANYTLTGLSAIGIAYTVSSGDLSTIFDSDAGSTFSDTGAVVEHCISDITKASPAVVTLKAHTLVTGDYIYLGDIRGMTQIDAVQGQVTKIGVDSFSIDSLDSTTFNSFTKTGPGPTASITNGCNEISSGVAYTVVAVPSTTSISVALPFDARYPYVAPTASRATIGEPSGSTYVDQLPSASLGEIVVTYKFDPPNTAMRGITFHPAGFMIGYFDNVLCFSEPGFPDAWPLDYRLSTEYDIVGIGIFASNILVVTEGQPYIANGISPGALNLVQMEMEQGGISENSIVDFGYSVVYASPDGLIITGSTGTGNVTKDIYSRQQWQALNPASFRAFNWEDRYLAFYSASSDSVQKAILLNPSNPADGAIEIDSYVTAGHKELDEDKLYVVKSEAPSTNNIRVWADFTTTKKTGVWRSKEMYSEKAINLGAAKVYAESYSAGLTLKLYADGVLQHTEDVTSERAFRLPGGYRAEKWAVEIQGTDTVTEITIASTMQDLSLVV